MTLDLTKPITTRDGRAVRILCMDGPGSRPIVGIIGQHVCCWFENGSYFEYRTNPQANDLINPPVKRRGWVNISLGAHGGYACGTVWDTQLEAKQAADTRTVDTVQLPEWEEPV